MTISQTFFQRKSVLAATLLLAVLVSLPGVGLQNAASAGTGPCDIYASGGTPCVGAHSTVRALFGAYSGRLYQVRRVSNGNTTDINTLTAGGYANAAAQDSFCAGTTCTITIIYDQTSNHNDLTIESGGIGSNGGQDIGALAHQLKVTAGGHTVYGAYISAGTGYRHRAAVGVAVNGQPESMYWVVSGTHANNGCCFDYGNAEVNVADTGNGHMDTLNFGTTCYFPPCSGSGPWAASDLENGLFQGNGSNTGDQTINYNFTTATLKNNGQTTFAIKAGNANSGGLTTMYNGTLPTGGFTGYKPMHQEGSIVMGTGGDNSNWSVGSFFEAAITSGYASDATENAVQANVVAVGYSGDSKGMLGGTIIGPGGKCVDVAADDVGGFGAPVQLWDCQSYAVDQHWFQNGNTSLSTIGRCLDINGNGTANGTQVELWECNNVGGQKWTQQADGSLKNPQSGRCLDSPNGATANGTRLQIWDCNGSPAQKFRLTGVVFYQDINYGGTASTAILQGDYATLPGSVPNDWMSSLRVPAGWTVQAYADGNFGGAVCTFTADTSWVGTGCNDMMSSVKIH